MADRMSVHGGTGRGRVALAGVVAIFAGAALPGSACAQRLLDQFIAPDIPGLAVEPDVTVLSRRRPEYDPPGIQLGEITIRPNLTEALGFDDNVLASRSHRGSAVVETAGQLDTAYSHSDTTADVNLTVDDLEFPEESRQSYTDWTAAASGSHQFGRDLLTVSYTHLNLFQTARDLDTPQLDQAIPYRVDTARLSYRAMFSRLFVQPTLDVSYFDFNNGTVLGQPYIQTYRNRTVVQPGVTLGYELAPNRNLVVVVRDAVASYRDQPAGQPRRDFNDVSVLGGLDFNTGGLFRYRLLAGFENRTFSSQQIKTIQAPVVEAEVIYSPTGLTTVTASASRRVQDSADEATFAVTETAVALRVDHEVRRNVLVNATGEYAQDSFTQGQGQQELFTAGAGVTWLLNRNLQLGGRYDFTRRVSSGAISLGTGFGQTVGPSFSENRVTVQTRVAF